MRESIVAAMLVCSFESLFDGLILEEASQSVPAESIGDGMMRHNSSMP
jgi:hypothetical protein